MANVLAETPNNLLRPYNSGVNQHDPTIATIVLYSSKDSDINSATSVQKDYFSNFNKKIEIATAIGSATSPSETNDKKTIPNLTLDNTSPYYAIFNNFSLVAVSERKEQIVKVHQNFGGKWNAFFFGDRPSVYSFTGFFLDSKEYPYYQEFMVAYDKYLKGRKSIENNYELVITYDGKIAQGFILNLQVSNSSEQPFVKNFVFTVLVKSENWFRMNYMQTENIERLNGMSNFARISSLTESDDAINGGNNISTPISEVRLPTTPVSFE